MMQKGSTESCNKEAWSSDDCTAFRYKVLAQLLNFNLT